LKQIYWVGLVCLSAVGVLGAQPYINARGVVNTASFTAPSLPGGAIAPGSVFTILGSGLGPVKPAQAASLPLGVSLAGVSVRVFQGTQVISALPLYVSSSQIHALMPSNAPLGRVSVHISYLAAISNPAPVTVVNCSFGVFTWNALDVSVSNGNAIFKDNSFVDQIKAAPMVSGATRVRISGDGRLLYSIDQEEPLVNQVDTGARTLLSRTRVATFPAGQTGWNLFDVVPLQ
jgi:hypothetical protein